MKLKRDKWLNHQFSSGSYCGEDYVKFQRDCRADLKKMAKEHNMELYSFNKDHYCFSAVLKTEDGKFIYISQSDVRYFPLSRNPKVLIRTMTHDKDWSGGSNNYCEWKDIGSFTKTLIKRA